MLNHLCKRLIIILSIFSFTTLSFAADAWPTCPTAATLSTAKIPFVEPDADSPSFGWSAYGQVAFNNKIWLYAVIYIQALDQGSAIAKAKQALAATSSDPIVHQGFDFSNDCMLAGNCNPHYTCIYHTGIDPHILIFAVNAPDQAFLNAQITPYRN